MRFIKPIHEILSIGELGRIDIPPDSLELVWEIPDGGLVITLPFKVGGNYDVEINWGDGSANSVGGNPTSTSWYTHTYTNTTGSSILRTTTVTGIATYLSFEPRTTTVRNALVKVTNLGDLGWISFNHAFYECTNLTIVSGGATSSVVDMSYMFYGCTLVTPSTMWDTRNVLDMSYMFMLAPVAVPNTSRWDTANVTDMAHMFDQASLATPDTSGWDVSSVTDMTRMFYRAFVATPTTDTWNTSNVTLMTDLFRNAYLAEPNVTSWDVTNVTTMTAMFRAAYAANPDVNSWALDSNPTLTYMFGSCTGMTNAVTGDEFWKNIDITAFGSCFDGAVNIANYDDIPGTWKGDARLLTFRFTTTLADTEIRLPFRPQGEYAAFINWDDGTNTSGDDGDDNTWFNHIYATPGTYDVTVNGYVSYFSFFYGTLDTLAAFVEVPELGATGLMDLGLAFASATNLLSVAGGDTANVHEMGSMFYGASSLATLDTSTWDTSNVTNMFGMFRDAVALNPDVSSWDVSSVTNMSRMFWSATIANPNVTNWDVSNITNMSSMFYNTDAANPDVSNWDTSSVTHMGSMFLDATAANPDVASWDVSNVIYITQMFKDAIIANPDISSWILNSCVDTGAAFQNCIAMTNAVPATQLWENPNITAYSDCFTGAINISNYDDIPDSWKGIVFPLIMTYTTLSSNVEVTLPFVDAGVYDLTIDWGDGSPTSSGTDGSDSSWYTHTYTTANNYVVTCTGIATYFSSLNLSATKRELLTTVTDLGNLGWSNLKHAFYLCDNLVSFAGGDTRNVTDMSNMFYNVNSATTLDLTSWDTSNVATMENMFRFTRVTDPVDCSGWDVSSVTNMNAMFNSTTNTTFDVSGWNTSNVTDMVELCRYANNLVIDLSGFDTSSVTNMYAMFGDSVNINPDVSNWDTSNVVGMEWMFDGSDINPDISNWDTSGVTSIRNMFATNTIANPDTSSWNLSSCTNAAYAFHNCTSMTNAVPAAQFWDNLSITLFTNCFAGAINISNYASIPAAWK